jgi:extracellular solute-binding protein
MSCPGLIKRFHDFWRDFNAVNCWKFPELPPSDLLQSLSVDLGGIDHAEFIRAKWMWTRRPKSLLGIGMSAYLLLVFTGLVLLLIPFAGIVLAPVWWFPILFVVAKDTVRLARWRRNYESSIGRLIRRCRKTK